MKYYDSDNLDYVNFNQNEYCNDTLNLYDFDKNCLPLR